MLFPGMFKLPVQSDKTIRIGLIHPNEGETFYAGPTSLLYNIPIQGWVESDHYQADEIKIGMAIYQNANLIINDEKYADSDGAFEFYATVNPEGSIENFPATQADCSSYCHYLSKLVLPAGEMTLELTAVDPAGNQDRIERHIIVDRSNYAIVPVQVILDDSESFDHSLANIPVSASTRLYLWRGRYFVTSTDHQGQAEIHLEALAEAPTQYWIQVGPSVVDGILYYSVEPVEISLPAGATTSAPITIRARTMVGRITGSVVGLDGSMISSARVLAVRVDNGSSFVTELSPQGSFVFDDIPLFNYMIIPDLGEQVLQYRFTPELETINLVDTPVVTVQFSRTDRDGYVLQGEIRGDDNLPMPFAWITNENLSLTERVMVESGNFGFYGLLAQAQTFTINAPGYYSRVYTLDPATDPSQDLSIILARQPETQSIPWGSGEIVIPPESLVELSEGLIRFEQGWLWGSNLQASEITIQTASADILLSQGKFAFENLPNQRSWFYQFEGSATILPSGDRTPIKLRAGEMIILTRNEIPVPIPIDQTVVTALHMGINDSTRPVWEPSLSSRIRDYVARIGIGSVQTITFITYGFILISVIGFPFVIIYFRFILRKQQKNEENNESSQ